MSQPVLLKFRSLAEAEDTLENLRQAPKIETFDQWNLLETLDHCATSLECTLRGYPEMKPEWFRTVVGPMAKHVFLMRGQMSHNTLDPIPGQENLPHSADQQTAFDRLFRAIADFRNWQFQVAEHFAYGKLDRAEAEKLQAFHIADHLSKMAWPR